MQLENDVNDAGHSNLGQQQQGQLQQQQQQSHPLPPSADAVVADIIQSRQHQYDQASGL
jgi:hypothetical protein